MISDAVTDLLLGIAVLGNSIVILYLIRDKAPRTYDDTRGKR